MARLILLILCSVSLIGCAKPTEDQRLSKFHSSIKYKTYCFASEKAVKVLVDEYNKRTASSVSVSLVHSILGIVWFVGEKSDYSLMEAELVISGASNDLKVLALGLESIALSKMKYPGLAKSRYGDLKDLLAKQQGMDTNKVEIEHKIMLLSVIAVSLSHGDPERAKSGADALGAISELDYLPPLVGAVAEARKGNPLKAAAQLRELNKSERFSEHRKVLLAEIADIIANTPQDQMEQEVTNRVILKLMRQVLEDVFSAENQHYLLEKAKALPEMITGHSANQSTSAGNAAVHTAPVN